MFERIGEQMRTQLADAYLYIQFIPWNMLYLWYDLLSTELVQSTLEDLTKLPKIYTGHFQMHFV